MGRVGKSGFSLIELMIVIAIIAIIAAFGYPSYQEYVKRTKRTEAKAELQRLYQLIESEKSGYRRYTAIPLQRVGLNAAPVQFPAGSTANYSISIWDTNGTGTMMTGTNIASTSWEIRAVPAVDKDGDIATNESAMAGDGTLIINQNGQKCWEKNTSGNCTPTALTNWDDD